ncbi:hypothetical protein AVEN_270523-1 [Araneus ventricosus]|uniref:Uncharacterized protein n=1 Tax=Araneus ventricosus TaxID=182803 RepID=A0A4Y2B4G5_ARAVE|nr:hypothetical protein AVEN_270523-1 [Araneus ventricosus]
MLMTFPDMVTHYTSVSAFAAQLWIWHAQGQHTLLAFSWILSQTCDPPNTKLRPRQHWYIIPVTHLRNSLGYRISVAVESISGLKGNASDIIEYLSMVHV